MRIIQLEQATKRFNEHIVLNNITISFNTGTNSWNYRSKWLWEDYAAESDLWFCTFNLRKDIC